MDNYRLGEEAKEDLIRIYQWGVKRFGMIQQIGISTIFSTALR
ncbi:hypothetical protein [Algoriphagus boritolerans]